MHVDMHFYLEGDYELFGQNQKVNFQFLYLGSQLITLFLLKEFLKPRKKRIEMKSAF